MSMTRREFTAGTTATLALTVLGCSTQADEKKDENAPNLAKEPFTIGKPSKYAKAGMYDEYKKEKGVWVVSDGKAVVVFSANCTHLKCTTHWKPETKLIVCPCHGSKFDLEGANQEGSKAKRPLERCSLSLLKSGEIQVDPTRTLRKDKDEWSDPAASVKIA